MSLFTDDEPIIEPDESINPVKVRAYPEPYRGIAVDTQYTPSSSLLLWISGSNWRVNYYSQVLDSTQEPTPLALDRKPPYQQYRKIIGIDLKVLQSLDPQQDERIRTFSVTGSGLTYPFLTPNNGDMFTANIGDGKIGLFTITSSRRTTFKRDSVYAVEWKMISELTTQQLENLDEKSIITYHYSQRSLLGNCGPFITEAEYEDSKRYEKLIGELTRRYLTDFYSREHSTFLVPDQELKTYDHFVTKAVLKVFDSKLDTRLAKVKVLNVQSEAVMQQPTIWDTLLYRDSSRLCDSTAKASLVSTRISRWRPELQAIGYTGIPRFVYPMEPPTDVDSQYNGNSHFRPAGVPFKEGQLRRREGRFIPQHERDLEYFNRNLNASESWAIPADINPVSRDEYYVFTEAFYCNSKQQQSKLEMLVWQMLNKETLNPEQLRAVTECCLTWDNLERFYYHPILIILLKCSLR